MRIGRLRCREKSASSVHTRLASRGQQGEMALFRGWDELVDGGGTGGSGYKEGTASNLGLLFARERRERKRPEMERE